MTARGRKRTEAIPGDGRPEALNRVRYRPPGQYALGLEVLSTADLRRRVNAAHLRAPQRVEFHMVMAVIKGRCTHAVDFVANDCRPGSWIVVRPGQAQRFDPAPCWEGWIVLCQPQFLLPRLTEPAIVGRLDALPSHLLLDAPEHRTCLAGVEQMRADSRFTRPEAERDTLLRHQIHALLLRLWLAHRRNEPQPPGSARSLRRINRFRDAVNASFASAHRVRDYAARLGYSEKSLTRSTLEVAGVSAKAYISQRIALEAKRLLAHTSQSVSEIGAQLGVDEPTNFVKFFKREVGVTPAEFRHGHGETR